MSKIKLEKNAPDASSNEEIIVGSEHETPMPSGQMFAYQLRASALIFIFYVYSAIAIILGGFTGLFFAIAAVRVPYSWSIAVVIFAILRIFCQSLRLGKGADFNIKLTQEEAPEFFHDIELLSQKLAVAPPREIVIESGPNAYVQLSGFFTGSGKTKLGFGFDFLAGLSKNQARSVLAHEMAHAKHVKRGYQGFLMRGLVRLSNCEASLQAVANYPDNSAMAKGIAKAFVFLPKVVVGRAAKLIAACSRYDEFLADRVAAQLIGPQIMKDALLATYVIDHQGAKLNWRERLLHIDRAPGYTAWLEKQFHVPDDEKRLEIEGRAIERAERSEFSTHPALPDRLKALDDFQGELDVVFGNDETIAATWLKNPDVTAKRLLGEVESVAAKEEAKATKELAKEAKKFGKQHGENEAVPVWGGYAFIGTGLLLVVLGINSLIQSGDGLAFGAFLLFAVVCAGVGVATISTRPARVEDIPIPTFVQYRAAQYRINKEGKAKREKSELVGEAKRSAELDEVLGSEAENIVFGREIRAIIPEGKPKLKIAAAINAAHLALGECNYKKALVACRIAFDLKPKDNADAMLAYVIASSAIHNGDFSGYLQLARQQRSGWNANWATAWMFCLLGATEPAETLLLELTRLRPKSACLWGLLGYCQAGNSKPRESINSRRRALELSQQTGDVDDEACHRFVLAQNLLALGQLTEAGDNLDWLRDYAKRETMPGLEMFSLELEWLRYRMAQGEDDSALQAAAEVKSRYSEVSQLVRLGYVLNESREVAFLNASQKCFEDALQLDYYPEAKNALAGIEFERENKVAARKLYLESLNCLRKRASEAAHPVYMLADVLNCVRAIDDEKPQKVGGHEIHLEIAKLGLDVDDFGIEKLSLLCFAPSLENATTRALEFFNALFPEREIAPHLITNPAPDNFQPKEPMVGGVYSCRWE